MPVTRKPQSLHKWYTPRGSTDGGRHVVSRLSLASCCWRWTEGHYPPTPDPARADCPPAGRPCDGRAGGLLDGRVDARKRRDERCPCAIIARIDTSCWRVQTCSAIAGWDTGGGQLRERRRSSGCIGCGMPGLSVPVNMGRIDSTGQEAACVVWFQISEAVASCVVSKTQRGCKNGPTIHRSSWEEAHVGVPEMPQ